MATSSNTITLKFTASDKASATIKRVGGQLQVMGRGISSMTQTMKKTTGTGNAFTRTLMGVGNIGKRINNQFMNLSNSFRLASQGMMSVGKAMSLFITPIIFLTLKKAAEVAIDFDAALVRVSKTTQLTGDALRNLAMGIREMGVQTSTSQVDLAKMAEQIGQLGVRDVPSILSLIDTFNMLTIATEISADKVAISMGKIANAFGIDLNTEEGAEEIRVLSSVINRLENELAASAPEILTGMENLAQVGAILDIPPTSAAAFVAALVSVGFSAEQAGTSLRNMTIKIVQNADKVAQAMGATEGYGSALDVLNMINEDAVKVISDLIHAAAQGDDAAQALFTAIEIGGIRGGKGLAALAGGYETLDKAVAVVSDELIESMSLWNEYQTALLSTKNQLKVLKNNVNEVALTIGDALLPVVNEIIQTVIPAIRWLAAAFKELPPEVMQMVLVGAVLLGVLGPIILFLSQIAFGIGMVMMAIGKAMSFVFVFIGALGGLGTALGGLAGGFGTVLTAGNLMVAGLVLGIGALILKFTGLGQVVADFFIGLGSAALSWGQNLIATYGEGLLSGAVNILGRVLTAIGNFIARFLAGSSPPDVGPLSHIDKWGENVFDAFLQGFLKADFGILTDVGRRVERVLSTLAKVGQIGDKQQFTFAMEARKDLAELIKVFNETGVVSENLLNEVTANLGEAADEVQDLIRHWLEYIDIQKQLAELEKQRKDALRTYEEEIELVGASNMSAEERVEAIREAMRARDQELKQIAQTEGALEEQEDVAKAQLDTQRAMLDAMQHQDDLQLKLIDTLDDLAGALDGLADFEFPPLDVDMGGATEAIEDVFESIVTLEEKIGMMAGIWDSFIAGFTDEPLDIEGYLLGQLGERDFAWAQKLGLDDVAPHLVPVVEKMQTAYDLGTDLGDAWEDISGFIQSAGEFLEGLKTGEIKLLPEGLSENVEGIAKALEPIGKFFAENMDFILLFVSTFMLLKPVIGILMLIGAFLGPLLGVGGIAGLGDVFAAISLGIGELGTVIGGTAIGAFFGELLAFIGLIVEAVLGGGGFITVLGGMAGAVVALLGAPVALAIAGALFVATLVKFGPKAAAAFKTLMAIIRFKFIELMLKASKWAQGIVDSVLEIWEDLKEGAGDVWEDVKDWIVTAWEDIKTAVSDVVSSIVTGIQEWWTTLEADAAVAWENFRVTIVTAVEDVKTAISDFVTDSIEDLQLWWAELNVQGEEAWTNFQTMLADKLGGIKTVVEMKIAEVVTAISDKWEQIKLDVGTKWEEVKLAIGTKIDEIKTAAGLKWDAFILDVGTKWEGVKTAIKDKIAEAKTIITDWIAEIAGFFTSDTLVTMGEDLIEGLKTGISTKVTEIKTWLNARLLEVKAIFDRIWAFGSPSKVTTEYGVQIMEGFAKGIKDASGLVDSTLGGSLTSSLNVGLQTAQDFALQGSFITPPMGEAPSIVGQGTSIVLQFNRDSVRNDDDITDIADEVERVLSQRAAGNISVGSRSGDAF